MSTLPFENNDYISTTCTEVKPQTIKIVCKCKRDSITEPGLDDVSKIRCTEQNCVNRIHMNGTSDPFDWAPIKETR